MTNQQLNNRVRKLAQTIKQKSNDLPVETYLKWIASDEARNEFMILNENIEYMTVRSLQIMICLNRRHRFLQIHQFATNLSLDNLIK